MPNKIFIISGPSGAGEDSVIRELEKIIKFNRVTTTVTRKKRLGEKQGKPYYFVTVKKFKELIKNNKLVEWAIVYGDYRGCTKKEINRLLKGKSPILWKADWQGIKTIKKIFPEAISILITSPSYQILEKRLVKRGKDSLKTIKQRERFTKEWLKHKNIYDYIVVNRQGKLKQTTDRVIEIIRKNL